MATFDISTLRAQGYRSTVPLEKDANAQAAASAFGQPITNSIFGINHMQTPLPVPQNRDGYGYTFFTRPQLNLQRANCLKDIRFKQLLGTEEFTPFRMLRCYLDPRLQNYQNNTDYAGDPMGVDCRLVDPFSPFISILSNHLVSLSGFPDKMSPVYKSPEGQYREVQSMVDGANHVYGAYNISTTFRNSPGDPITKIFEFWEDYQSLVFEGVLVPYLDVMLAGLIDYNTRIYRFTTDRTKRYVTGLACTGASFPTSLPKGQQYDYNTDKPYNDANNQMTYQFESNGAWFDNPIIIWAFNKVMGAFNPSMRTVEDRRSDMVLIPAEVMEYFNCRAYPRIDPATRRLEWYVTRTYYQAIYEMAKGAIDMMRDISAGTPVQNMITQEATAPNGFLNV